MFLADVESSQKAYEKGINIAQDLPPANPIRLGIHAKFAMFIFEILSSPDRACDIAKQVRCRRNA